MLRRLLILCVCVLGSIPGLAQERAAFRARLATVPIDIAMQDAVAGSGKVTATLSGRTLTITGSFEGLKSPATVARVHRGPKGIRGSAIFDLAVTPATQGTITGTLELTPAQVDDVTHERFYVQLHSEKAPEGNLWGWLLREEVRK